MRVLLVEDDDGVAGALADTLAARGHRGVRCASAARALAAHHDVDLVLLDLGLPDMDGIDLLRRLRRVNPVPVVVLTARGDERSVVRGLRSGADDYLVKPVRMEELFARIDAVTRRAARAAGPDDRAGRSVTVGDLAIDLDARVVRVDGEPVRLTTKEFDVLAVLARNAGAAVSRQQVMDEVWGDAYLAVSRSLDVHMAAVRGKVGRPELLATIRGFGFRLG